MRLCLVVHGINVVLHQNKVRDLEEMITELKSSLADRARLLRSAFDATCHVRVLPIREEGGLTQGPLQRQMEMAGHTLAGRLQIVFGAQLEG